MPESLDELTYDYEDEGVLVRKQIDRAVLTKGSWATVMFLFQELDRAKAKFRPPKMAIVRFKKSKGSYRKQSSFNISNEKQARQITEVLEGWYPKIAEMTAEMTAAMAADGGDQGSDGGVQLVERLGREHAPAVADQRLEVGRDPGIAAVCARSRVDEDRDHLVSRAAFTRRRPRRRRRRRRRCPGPRRPPPSRPSSPQSFLRSWDTSPRAPR